MSSTGIRRRSENERHGEHARDRSDVGQEGDRINAETANGPRARSRAEQRAAAQAKAGAEVVATSGERDPGMAKLAECYFRHTPLEELAAAEADQLMAAVRAHYQLAEHRAPCRPAIRVRDGSAVLGRSCTVVEIVTDDMPFLVESVTGAIRRSGAFVQRVMHPIVVVRRELTGELVEVLPDADVNDPPMGTQLESWMHIETDPLDDAEARERLAAELTRVLADVREVVEDSDRMRHTAHDLARTLRAEPPPLDPTEVEEVAGLLEWLADDHLTFLGYRRYELDTSGERPKLTAVLASGLGVLRGDNLSTRSFAPGTDEVERATSPELLLLSQASSPSRVSRPVYPLYLSVKTFDTDEGGEPRVTGEHRFLGLLTVAALYANPLEIPVVAHRVHTAIRRAGYPLESYSGQRMLEVIASYPREELFQASADDLYETALGVLSLAERRRLRLFARRDPYHRFFSCLIYLPRDRYTTAARLRMQDVLMRELHGRSVDYTARVTESSLALLHATVHIDPDERIEIDVESLRERLSEAIQTWDDRVLAHIEDQAELTQEAKAALRPYVSLVPAAFKEDFDPAEAAEDLARLDRLGDEPEMIFYTPADVNRGERRFKLFLAGEEVALTTLLPVLQQMGVEVIEERPYQITRPDGRRCWIYDFGLRLDAALDEVSGERRAEEAKAGFCSAFAAAWRGDIEVDRFNALVLRGGLTWRQVALLRGYARYLRQIGTPYGQQYLADTLIRHAPVAAALVRLFEARFDPALRSGGKAGVDARSVEPVRADEPERTELVERRLTEVTEMIDQVAGLDADRILRGYLNLITSTLRTNYFCAGGERPYLALKLDPGQVRELPLPRPRFEIFVYSPRVEGVHLRFGPVARGGLRWSDRPADFRTEILGLVKAQAVKNAVIVPVGAKGGFVVKRSPAPTGDPAADREALQREGITCYRMLISGLLDLTDNLVNGTTVPPDGVVRHDGDDSYLVVAADKGTATFSDIANDLAVQRGFWLGDAFASGGSVGYDHKAMGITAKGAWESVKRHFRELGVDTQSQEFTVVGIGDMSGDVFGNGMLLSEHIKLVAAFDHRHVFVDPDPDPARSYAERRRLFELARSSWDDYDKSLISAGGGVWSRTTKAIPVSAQMRAALGLADDVRKLTPPELIRAILLAPVDLLWNGGVGTYVKASTEANSEVGDKANDLVRVDGSELRVKVIGEGGNLGLTQRGRIEFARAGGKVNTDALDNSAGVDCSDHEVNIKIPLGRLVAAGELTEADRRELLAEMTDEVARLVLDDNRAQNTVLGVSRSHAAPMVGVHARLVTELESRSQLDRELDVLPTPAGFTARGRAGEGLTSPELATLLAHVKLDLKAAILDSELPDAAVFAQRVRDYFPAPLRERYPKAVDEHPLRREIVTTLLVNEMVGGGGVTFAFRLAEELAAGPADALRAYATTTRVFGLPELWARIERLDTGGELDTALADELVLESRRLLDRAVRWFLTNRPQPLAVGAEISRFAPSVAALRDRVPDLLVGRESEAYAGRVSDLVKRGVPAELAERVGALLNIYPLLDITEITELAERERDERDPAEVAELYYAMSDHLGIDLGLTSVSNLQRGNRWHALARLALRDDLYGSLRAITLDALRESSPGSNAADKIADWERANASKLSRARAALQAVGQAGELDLATLSVVSRQLRGLAR